jgi:hypothetical protein
MLTKQLSRSLLSIVGAVALMAPLYSAYKGHADDRDVNAILSAYPSLKGGPADSCATCHVGGRVKRISPGDGMRDENHCDDCHAAFVRDKKDVRETLNRFGRAYLDAGRNAAAVTTLAAKDSDGDGASNEAELKAGTNPGDASSSPSRPGAPSRTIAVAALKALAPAVDQVVFLNSTKSRSGDTYSDFRGLVLADVLRAVGLLDTAESVDLLSVDGYERTFTLVELRAAWAQGVPVTGLGRAELGACGWVTYASRRLEAGKPLPPAKILLAFEENGQPLEKARIDPDTGRILGKGPLRVVVPQLVVAPPDLPLTADPSCSPKVTAEYRFHEEYDHNAGASQSAVVAIRVKPLPRGTRDIDWQTAAARLLANEEVVIFGAIRTPARRPAPREALSPAARGR